MILNVRSKKIALTVIERKEEFLSSYESNLLAWLWIKPKTISDRLVYLNALKVPGDLAASVRI